MPYTPSSDRATTRKPETAPPRIATWTASTRLRRAAAAVRTLALTLMYMPMMPGRHRAGGADDERQTGPPAEIEAEDLRVGDLLAVSKMRDHAGDDERPDDGEDADRRVLATDEGDRAFEDRAGHVLHLGGPGVARRGRRGPGRWRTARR